MAKDIFHENVKTALQKNGWRITHDPLAIVSMGFNVLIDLGADNIIAADRDAEKIAVEIKSFAGASDVSQFHMALGQFLNYRDALGDQEPDRTLFLAIPLDAFETTFQLPFVRRAIERYELRLAVYDPEEETILQWIK